MSGHWQGSNRKATLPSNWSTLRQQTKARADGRCEHTDNGQRCQARGTDCDHIGNAHDHSLTNLRWLCRPHHNKHTAQQAAQARAAQRAKLTHPSTHATPPGLIT